MINTKGIRKLLIEKEMGVKDFAEAIGRSYTSTIAKLNGNRGITLSEAEKWQEVLGITDSEFTYYFLNHDQAVWHY